MNPILVIYYSRTGNTDALARRIAAACSADIHRIAEPPGAEHKSGVFGFFKSLKDTFEHSATEIEPIPEDKSPEKYALVAVGTPDWGGAAAAPVQTFLRQYNGKFPALAFFCTDGVQDHAKMWEDMGHAAGRQAEATLGVPGIEIKPGKFEERADSFGKRLSEIAARLRSAEPLSVGK